MRRKKKRRNREKKEKQGSQRGLISSTAQGYDLIPVIKMAKSLQICHTESQRSSGDSHKARGGREH